MIQRDGYREQAERIEAVAFGNGERKSLRKLLAKYKEEV